MHLRKAHYMLGWDWGAHLPDAGIFRPVSLIGIKEARIDSVYVIQKHENENVNLKLNVWINKEKQWNKELKLNEENIHEFSYKVCIVDTENNEYIYENSPKEISIENPKLWWPNGLGEQPLYKIKVILLKYFEVLDVWEDKIGLRRLTVCREKDEWGESFAHEINGYKVFAMGADYIPQDHLLGRINKEKTKKLLLQCKMANFNCVRVWGGGYYPDDWFFEICDELGLMVWEDFMFACSVYELTPEFEANITKEFIDNIKRIRNHACLALWCGNNEMETFVNEKRWVTKQSEVRDYILMYERIIPKTLEIYDPETFYWPASPSSGGSFDNPNDPNRGDVHYWEVWHGNKPFSEYREHFFRYASEFGFQSFPCMKTIEKISDNPKDYNPFSYIMEKHQRNYGANGKIMNYLQQTYLYPTSFEMFLYASQLLQAESIKYGVEHFRRNRGRCMGAIYWQLNDCWPVISWSSIDYYGRLKALHYYAKRFFAPVMISCQEEGMMSAKADMNRQHFEFEKSIRLNVTNETRNNQKVLVSWAIRNSNADIIKEQTKELEIPKLSSVWLDKVLLPEINIFNQYVSYNITQEGKEISSGTVIFSYPKYFEYKDPCISYEIVGDEIILYAKAYAKSIKIQNENEDLILSDNYFDMNSGKKSVKIISGDISKININSVYDIK